MVFGYAVYLLWAALSSEPDDYSCVFQKDGGQQETIKARAPSVTTISQSKGGLQASQKELDTLLLINLLLLFFEKLLLFAKDFALCRLLAS